MEESRVKRWAWKRPRRLPRRRAAFWRPPLLAWAQLLVEEGAVPPATTHVALGYLQAMEDMKHDTSVSAAARQHSARLLSGAVGRSKAHAFMHMVLEDARQRRYGPCPSAANAPCSGAPLTRSPPPPPAAHGAGAGGTPSSSVQGTGVTNGTSAPSCSEAGVESED